MADFTIDTFAAYVGLLIMAIVPIILGSYRSLSPAQVETLSTKDAMMFPVVGSAVLFSLYLVFKFLSKEYVNMLMSFYFLAIGISALTAAFHPVLAKILPASFVNKQPIHINFKLPAFIKTDAVDIKLSYVDIVGGALGAVIAGWYFMTKHWIANNILGEAFSIVGIELISLGSVKIGILLLCLLFFYDIFWVFATDVMVTVAKSFDAPIKLVFPKEFITSMGGSSGGFALLGLGDIVIPGIFIALMLRFDYDRFKNSSKANAALGLTANFPKPYFHTVLFSYFLGLVLTVTVMQVFKAAQPALLYLVPANILSVLLCALVRGELKLLFAYEEQAQPEETATTTTTPVAASGASNKTKKA